MIRQRNKLPAAAVKPAVQSRRLALCPSAGQCRTEELAVVDALDACHLGPIALNACREHQALWPDAFALSPHN